MLVEADGDADLGHTGADRRDHTGQGAAAGGTTVGHVDEGNASEAQVVGQSIGIAGILATAVGHTDLIPVHPGVAQRLAHGEGALRLPGQAIGAAEGVHADTDDGDVFHYRPPSFAGAKAKVCNGRPSARWP
ncbi:hypothetical protein D3C85_1589360 [compost metagenome]